MLIDTQTTPEHWKTVGSRGTLMAGNAVLNAAEEAIRKLKEVASCVLRVPVGAFPAINVPLLPTVFQCSGVVCVSISIFT
jgi:CO/xanthine dehydrogenase Mo-binding subunit